MAIHGKVNFEVIYEKIRVKRKIIKTLEEQAYSLRCQNVDNPDILRLHRNIWDLEAEVKELLAEFRGQKNNIKRNLSVLSFDDIMDYIGYLLENNDTFKIKRLMNSIKQYELSKEQQILFKDRKEYLESRLGVIL